MRRNITLMYYGSYAFINYVTCILILYLCSSLKGVNSGLFNPDVFYFKKKKKKEKRFVI